MFWEARLSHSVYALVVDRSICLVLSHCFLHLTTMIIFDINKCRNLDIFEIKPITLVGKTE